MGWPHLCGMSTRDHPFYCRRKQCRKSVWATPEYLSDRDWRLVEGVVSAFTTGDRAAFEALLEGDGAAAFFYRVIGWPEGLNYYVGGSATARANYFAGFCRDHADSELSRLRGALAARLGPLFTDANASLAHA
jgi:hypothetical protein